MGARQGVDTALQDSAGRLRQSLGTRRIFVNRRTPCRAPLGLCYSGALLRRENTGTAGGARPRGARRDALPYRSMDWRLCCRQRAVARHADLDLRSPRIPLWALRRANAVSLASPLAAPPNAPADRPRSAEDVGRGVNPRAFGVDSRCGLRAVADRAGGWSPRWLRAGRAPAIREEGLLDWWWVTGDQTPSRTYAPIFDVIEERFG